MTPRDLLLATKTKKHGARYSLRIILEARAAGIPISLGFALVEHESGFRNVFGHDPTIFVGGRDAKTGRIYKTVTRGSYLEYKRQRGTVHMQGVGPCQLTWWETQDAADKIGGCWRPGCNIRVAFRALAALISEHGYGLGIERYNGVGDAAVLYSKVVQKGADRWHIVLS